MAGSNWLPTAQADPSGNCTDHKYDSAGRTTDSYTGFSSTSASGCETKPSGVARFHKDYNSNGSVADSYDGNGSSTSTDEQTNYT